jgi:hypothetical protein
MTIETLLEKINGVTVYHRYGDPVPVRALMELQAAQTEMESQLKRSRFREPVGDDINYQYMQTR